MKVYMAKGHDGHWPVGTASVVVAEDITQAMALLDAALIAQGLKPFKDEQYTLVSLDTSTPAAYVLCNGDY